MSRRIHDAPGQVVLFDGTPEATQSCPSQFERDEFRKLLQRLHDAQREAGVPAGAVSWFSFRELLCTCRAAGVFTWLLPVDDSLHEQGRVASQLGLILKRYYRSPTQLEHGFTAYFGYERSRATRYWFAVGRSEVQTAETAMRRLIEALTDRIIRNVPDTAGKRLGQLPTKWEFRFRELKAACLEHGLFRWLDLGSSSGEASLGLVFRKFRGERFQTGRGFYRFEENYLGGRQRRYRIEAVVANSTDGNTGRAGRTG